MPQPADGELLLTVLLVSLDAANRAWMQGATYRAALGAGQVMAGARCPRWLGTTDAKTLALYRRNGDGVDLQSNHSSCQQAVANEGCH